MEEFISTVSIQHQKDSSFMVSIPHRIVKKLNMDSIRVNLDLGTIIENKEDMNIIDNNIQYINHIHISEPYLDIIKNKKIYEDLAIILKNNNYSNFVSIEMKNQNNIDEVKKCILYIRGIF